jgi:hypothetical protein
VTQLDLAPLAYPLFAPLPLPMILHLGRGPSRTHPAASDQPFSWRVLEQHIRSSRNSAYVVMHPFVANRQLTTSWLLKTLTINTPGKTPVPPSTLNLWHERGIFTYQERGQPDPDGAAAMLIARMTDPRERNWLPVIITRQEPRWWCWRQDSPTAPILACPIPLPDDVPAAALLWTPWPGASWHNPWLQVGTLGAIRFAGTRGLLSGNEWSWSLSMEEFRQWDPEMAAFALPGSSVPRKPFFTRTVSHDLFHTLAQASLLRLALANVRLGLFSQSGPIDFTALGIELDPPLL